MKDLDKIADEFIGNQNWRTVSKDEVVKLVRSIRDEALDRAAKVVDDFSWGALSNVSEAIRALKSK